MSSSSVDFVFLSSTVSTTSRRFFLRAFRVRVSTGGTYSWKTGVHGPACQNMYLVHVHNILLHNILWFSMVFRCFSMAKWRLNASGLAPHLDHLDWCLFGFAGLGFGIGTGESMEAESCGLALSCNLRRGHSPKICYGYQSGPLNDQTRGIIPEFPHAKWHGHLIRHSTLPQPPPQSWKRLKFAHLGTSADYARDRFCCLRCLLHVAYCILASQQLLICPRLTNYKEITSRFTSFLLISTRHFRLTIIAASLDRIKYTTPRELL